jgi:hypothetical protein
MIFPTVSPYMPNSPDSLRPLPRAEFFTPPFFIFLNKNSPMLRMTYCGFKRLASAKSPAKRELFVHFVILPGSPPKESRDILKFL